MSSPSLSGRKRNAVKIASDVYAVASKVFKCTSREEYRAWVRFARVTLYHEVGTPGTVVVRNAFCGDCAPEFRADMEAENRCWRATVETPDISDVR